MNTIIKTGKDLLKEENAAIETRLKIREKFASTVFPNPILEPIYFGRLNKTMVDNKKLVRDATSEAQYAVVSNKYKVVHHEDVLKDFIDAIPEEFGKPIFDISMLSDGARMVATAKFPEITDLIQDSPVNMRIRLQNSYDTSILVGFSWGAEELICSNGLVAYVEWEKSKARHLPGSFSKLQLNTKITASFALFSKQIDLWQSWVKKQISETQMTQVMEALPFSETEVEKLKILPIINHANKTLADMPKPSIWAIHSVATQYTKHEITSTKRAIDLEEKIAKTITTFASAA